MTLNDLREKLRPLFEKNGIVKAIVFGSYAKDGATQASDIDIIVRADETVKGLRFYGIRSEIEEFLNIEVDLIPEQDVVSGGRLDQEVKKTGVVIYERQTN